MENKIFHYYRYYYIKIKKSARSLSPTPLLSVRFRFNSSDTKSANSFGSEPPVCRVEKSRSWRMCTIVLQIISALGTPAIFGVTLPSWKSSI